MAEITTTGRRLYLTNLQNLERLEIQFVPKELNLTRSPTYGDIQIVGRNTPVPHYTGGNTSLSMELDFYSSKEDRQDVVQKCKWLESLAYNDGYSSPPPNVRLTYGELFKNGEVWIVKSVGVRYTRFSSVNDFLPVQAFVSITLQLDPEFNLKRTNVLWRN